MVLIVLLLLQMLLLLLVLLCLVTKISINEESRGEKAVQELKMRRHRNQKRTRNKFGYVCVPGAGWQVAELMVSVVSGGQRSAARGVGT